MKDTIMQELDDIRERLTSTDGSRIANDKLVRLVDCIKAIYVLQRIAPIVSRAANPSDPSHPAQGNESLPPS